jgi:hypothetical protein
VPGDRVEHRHRLVEHQQPRPPGQRQRQRELGLLAVRHVARLLLEQDAELAQPGLRVVLILVVNSGSCGEAEFEACQVAGSLPV